VTESSQPEPDVRDEDLAALIARRAAASGDRTFMSFGRPDDGVSMTFAGFERRVAGFRGWLASAGVEPGNRVALMLKNSLASPVAWLGVTTAGAVAVPVNSRLGEVDARFVMEHSGATALVTDEATEPVARAAAPDAVRAVFVARTHDPMAELEWADPAPVRTRSAGDLANIQYTSGTTGFPKGCRLTHRFWQRMGRTAVEIMAIGERDTLLTSQPHSYIDPQWNAVAALRAGARLVLLDGFHPSTFMRSVAEWGVTVFYCLGVMPTLLLKQRAAVHDRDHRLERVFSSAVPVEHHAAIEERWGVPWFEAFGMTETGINLAVAPTDHDRLVGSRSLGRVLPHCEAAALDDDDRQVPPGRVGELSLRGLGFMEGYHRDPEATAAFFRNGWAHTGDLVRREPDGTFTYVGRRKEMIRRGGENISPVEIETALSTHPGVLECAVAPVPDPDLGEEIKAYVVPRGPAADGPDAEALATFLAERIARFKVPRYWEFRAELPYTPSEKVAKGELEPDDGWRDRSVDVRGDR
jgi:crotonobetaine/carnitine-CoA ligase